MYKENHLYWDDASNDLYKLSGLSGMDYIRSLPENMAYSLPIPPNIDVEENDNHSSPNLIIETKGDDFFINPNIQPSDNKKSTPIETELKEILGKKKKLTISIRESKRKWNQYNVIKRNLIQNIILKWLNFSINDPNIKIRKIDANLFTIKYKTFNNIIDLPLKVIYSNNICKKEIKGEIEIDNNIKIIKNIEKNSDLDSKMDLTIREVKRR